MNKTIIQKATCFLFDASWADINFLYEHKWISCEEIKKYVDEIFFSNPNDYLNDLLWSKNNSYDFFENLKILSDTKLPDFEKVALICVYDIWKSKKSFKEVQNLIEELYCDLSHLELLAPFVSYMPPEKEGDFFLEENYELKIEKFLERKFIGR